MWNDLTMQEKADVISMAVKAGLRDLGSIRSFYNDTVGSRRFEDGGRKNTPRTTGGAGYITQSPSSDFINDVIFNLSRGVMSLGQNGGLPSTHRNYEGREPIEGIAQATYLMPRSLQQKKFEEFGYQRKDKDYGLVKAAVGDKDIPVYQRHPDAIRREELQPIGNLSDHYMGPRGTGIRHAGHFPTAIYTDANGNLFQKAWDLNDYGDNGRSGAASRYTGLKRIVSKLLDTIGSPTVVTTGYQPIIHGEQQATLSDPNPEIRGIVDSYLQSKGLRRYNSEFYIIDGKVNVAPAFIGLPEVTVYGNKKAEGGSIHIAQR